MLYFRTGSYVSALACGLVLLAGCEQDLTTGTFTMVGTGTSRALDGTTNTIQRTFLMDVQLAVDNGGPRPDVLVFNLCNDAVNSPLWTPCFEPIEAEIKQNIYGAEDYSYGSFGVPTDFPMHTCFVTEIVVISGEVLDPDHLTFHLTYTMEFDPYESAPECYDLYYGPTYISMDAEGDRNGAE